MNPTVSARWIDVEAPFDLALATVAAREALVGPRRDPFNLAGSCQIAARAVALGLRRRGREALCLPGECTCDHLVVLVDGWVLDPTAEQFGTSGPWLCPVEDLPSSDYDLDLWVDDCYLPDEDVPRAWEVSDRLYEERLRLYGEGA